MRVLSCGLDEVPGVYKDIRKVMDQQSDLVDIVARFDPKLVKMSDQDRAVSPMCAPMSQHKEGVPMCSFRQFQGSVFVVFCIFEVMISPHLWRRSRAAPPSITGCLATIPSYRVAVPKKGVPAATVTGSPSGYGTRHALSDCMADGVCFAKNTMPLKQPNPRS